MQSEADWNVLARLFADGQAAFRHHLGLSRRSAREFYAPTAEAAFIREQKQTVLASAQAELYLVETAEGWAAFQEFARSAGCEVAGLEAGVDRPALNRAATLALEPDWILLTPGDWKLAWASVCFPTKWSLEGKRLQPLLDIHGVVPGLNAELGRKIDVFFGRLTPGEGWARANWGLSSNAELNQHPSRPYTPLSPETSLAEVSVRVESQHLGKLPGCGAIAFGIRILNFPLEAVAQRAEIVAGLKEQLRTMPAEMAAYKGVPGEFWRRL